MSAYQISEGRATRSIAVDIGLTIGETWQNTDIDYDVAIGGIPFLIAPTQDHPYQRDTTQFRKNQYDTQRDPGEQSLTNWWIRSQSSFQAGNGIKFYDPFANPFSVSLASNSYRFKESLGLNVMEFGQVTLLNRMNQTQSTTNAIQLESVSIGGNDKLLVLDGNIKVTDGTTAAMTTLVTAASTSYPIQSIANDGTNVYYIDNGHIYQQIMDGSTSAVALYPTPASSSITSSRLGWAKQRLVACINNNVYQITGTGGSLPTPVYSHPNVNWKWTGIDEGGVAIYASGYAGTNSAIYKFALDNTGAMPVLSVGVIAAQLPAGETVQSIYVHLNTYICIGTNKGVRVGTIDPTTGDITYGQILNTYPMNVTGFAAQNSFIWAAGTVFDYADSYAGTMKIDLSDSIDNLMFAIAQDAYIETGADDVLTGLAFLGTTNQLAMILATDATTSTPVIGNQGLWVQSATEVYPSGWIDTGYIRYNMLEPKNFKRVLGHADVGIVESSTTTAVTKGSVEILTFDDQGNYYNVITYDNIVGTPEATISQPIGAQDSLGLRFQLNRDANDNTLSPVFTGYQLKAVPATPRTRTIKVPLLCYDIEQDKYSGQLGYEGQAWAKLSALEQIENIGDVVTFQDFRTGETQQILIESLSFINSTPPDRRLSNFGGLLIATIRTV